MSTPGGDWVSALDGFEHRLAAQEAALASGVVEPTSSFDPPSLPTPLPHALVERATALVWRCRALEESLEQALKDAAAQLDRIGEAGPARTPSQPVFFDSRV